MLQLCACAAAARFGFAAARFDFAAARFGFAAARFDFADLDFVAFAIAHSPVQTDDVT